MKLPQPIQYQGSKRLLVPFAWTVAAARSMGILGRRQVTAESREELSPP